VQISVDAANAGDVVSTQEIEAEATAWRAETRRKMDGANSGWRGKKPISPKKGTKNAKGPGLWPNPSRLFIPVVA
jgi:hypothetical protein